MNAEQMLELERRARIHSALGDPGRLAITDALSVGDASPGEIAAQLEMASNLVAHHLNVLTAAGVVERSRSEADRRRTYVRLRPDTLAALKTPTLTAPPRVVFVCTRNSARSQLAAALWAAHSGIPVASAGTDPAPMVNPRAVRIARKHGLSLNPRHTAHIDDIAEHGDLLIAVCDHAHETLPASASRLHWSVPDPVAAATDKAFAAAYAEIAARIDRLATVVLVKE